MLAWPIILTVALGHVCLAVLAINVIHGLGLREGPTMSLVKWLLVVLLAGATALLGVVVAGRPWSGWPWAVRAYAILCLMVALVGLPAITWARSRRRYPPHISGKSRSVDLTTMSPRDDLIGTGLDSLWLRVPGNQAFQFSRTEWEIEYPDLPRAWEGLRILHLTDLHLTRAYSDRFFESVIAQVEDIEADLVVFTGDLIDDESKLDRIEPLLSRLRGRLGQFAILGNHDYRFPIDEPIRGLKAAGFEILEGAWHRIACEGAMMVIGGTSAPWGPLPDPAEMPEADFRLLLSHSPDTLHLAASWGIDLMLSGHTHGGQYRLPIVGPVLLPSLYSRRYDCGFFHRDRTVLYVSRGIAAQHPLRVNCPPEVACFTLRAARLDSPAATAHASTAQRPPSHGGISHRRTSPQI